MNIITALLVLTLNLEYLVKTEPTLIIKGLKDTVGNNQVQYIFQVYNLNKAIPSDGLFEIVFPSGYDLYNPLCFFSVGIQPDSLASCSKSEAGTLIILNAQSYAQDFIQFALLDGLKNPSDNQTRYFNLFTYDSNSNILDSIQNIPWSIQPGLIPSIKITANNYTTSSITTATLNFTLKNPLPQNAYFLIDIPFWNSQAPQSSKIKAVGMYIICGAIHGIEASISCTLNDNGQLKVDNGFRIGGNTTSYIVFTIRYVKMPYSLTPQSGFNLWTLTSAGAFIDKIENFSLTSLYPSLPQQVQIISANRQIRLKTNLSFLIKPVGFYPKNSSIEIQFPVEFDLSNINEYQIIGIENLQTEINFTYNGYKLVLQNCIQSYISESQTLQFMIQNVKNFQQVQTSQSFMINIIDPYQSIINSKNSNFTYTSTPGQVYELQITPQNISVNTITTYYFSLKIQNSLTSTSSIIIKFPLDIKLVDRDIQDCNIIEGLQNSSQCSVNNNVLTINKPFQNTSLPNIIQFSINQVQNPSSVKPSQNFQIQTFDKNYLIDMLDAQNSQVIVAQSKSLDIINLYSQDQQVSNLSNYVFQLKNREIVPQNGKIVINFPSSFVLDSILCTFHKGFGVSAFCLRSGLNTIEIGPGQLLLLDSNISFTIQNIMNPRSFKPTESFLIEALDNSGYLILTSSGQIAKITMSKSIQITKFSLILSNNTVNSLNNLKIKIKSPLDLIQSDKILLTIPKEGQFNISQFNNSCSIYQQGIMQNIQCSYDNSSRKFLFILDLPIQKDSEIITIVYNLVNPNFVNQFTGYKIYITDKEDYLIATIPQTQVLNVSVSNPANLHIYDIRLSSLYVSEITEYIFQFLNQVELPIGGYIEISNSLDIINQSIIKCQQIVNGINIQFASCYNQTQKTLLLQINESISVGNISINLKLKNLDTNAGIQNQFRIRTLDKNQNLISTGFYEMNITFKCHSSCLSCFGSPMNCTQCQPNYFKLENSCELICPTNTYQVNQSCIGCQVQNCQKCSNESPFQCKICNQYMILHQNQCIRPSDLQGQSLYDTVQNNEAQKKRLQIEAPKAIIVSKQQIVLLNFLTTESNKVPYLLIYLLCCLFVVSLSYFFVQNQTRVTYVLITFYSVIEQPLVLYISWLFYSLEEYSFSLVYLVAFLVYLVFHVMTTLKFYKFFKFRHFQNRKISNLIKWIVFVYNPRGILLFASNFMNLKYFKDQQFAETYSIILQILKTLFKIMLPIHTVCYLIIFGYFTNNYESKSLICWTMVEVSLLEFFMIGITLSLIIDDHYLKQMNSFNDTFNQQAENSVRSVKLSQDLLRQGENSQNKNTFQNSQITQKTVQKSPIIEQKTQSKVDQAPQSCTIIKSINQELSKLKELNQFDEEQVNNQNLETPKNKQINSSTSQLDLPGMNKFFQELSLRGKNPSGFYIESKIEEGTKTIKNYE